jgi:hypothetical protein
MINEDFLARLSMLGRSSAENAQQERIIEAISEGVPTGIWGCIPFLTIEATSARLDT